MNELEKLVESKKMPVIFVGSGISKRYLHNYPDWNELLELSFKKYNQDMFQFQKHIDTLKRQELSPFEINTKMATIIENEFNSAFYDRKIKINVGNSKNPTWVRKGISPYKMFLSVLFKKMKVTRNTELRAELEKFKMLKSKVAAVITTNYDSFLENEIFQDDYTVFVHQNDLFGSDSYNIAEIYKIHGSVTDANTIVITEADYNKFNDSRKLIIAKMLTLFAEAPIVFLGYSFTDENIHSIVVDFLSCLSAEQIESINEHFIFISYKKGEQTLQQVQRTIITAQGHEIPITEICTDNFSLVYDTLNQITPGVSPLKIRETKRVIKNIVDASITSSNAESVIVGIDDLSDIDLSSKPLAVAIGYKENILSKFGYGLFEDNLILEDILYDNKNFDADSMCIDRFKSIAYTRLLPVFKYVKKTTVLITEESKLRKYIESHNSVEKIITNKIQKSLKSLPEIQKYDELLTALNSVDGAHKKAGLLLKNITNFSNDEVRKVCKVIYEYDRDAAKTSTHFKRCVMYLDFIENYKVE